MFKIITEEPPSLRELDPTVSDEMLRIIAKALSKAPETRYQSGRELADDLLAITRPGFVPTLRSRDAPTLPPDAPPADVPTLQELPTVRPEPTIASKATTPFVPPTILTPATAKSAPPPLPTVPPIPLVPRPQAPAAARAARPPAADSTRRKGGGAGMIVGLGIAGALLLALLAVGGYFLTRRGAEPTPAPIADATPLPSAPPTAAPDSTSASPSPTTQAEAVPTTSVTTAPPATQPPARSTTATTPGSGASTAGSGTTRPARDATASATSASEPPAGTAPAGDDFAHLDDLPSDEGDGRAAGDALAQKYRSGGGSSYTTGRFRERPKVPRGVTVQERPAVATLFYIHTVEQAYQRSNGRYGTLQQLKDAGLLALDVPLDAAGFRRQRYSFRVAVEPDGYRAEAIPLAPVGRSFLVDDTGKVRLADE